MARTNDQGGQAITIGVAGGSGKIQVLRSIDLGKYPRPARGINPMTSTK